MACYTAQKIFHSALAARMVVCDVPSIIEAAKRVAAREGESSRFLRFTTELKKAGACDIFFSSGAAAIHRAAPSNLAH